MGCLTPGPNPSRIYIDPTYPQLWQTMDKIFGVLNGIFPPEYPFHVRGVSWRGGWRAAAYFFAPNG